MFGAQFVWDLKNMLVGQFDFISLFCTETWKWILIYPLFNFDNLFISSQKPSYWDFILIEKLTWKFWTFKSVQRFHLLNKGEMSEKENQLMGNMVQDSEIYDRG